MSEVLSASEVAGAAPVARPASGAVARRGALLVVVLALAAGAVVALRQGVRATPEAAPAEASAPADPNIIRVPDETARELAGVQLATVTTRPVASEIVCNGYVGFNENRYAQIRLRVDGILKRVRVDVGAPVRAGQELAVVDSATLGEYKSSYVYAMVNVHYAESYCERLRKLAEQQAIPSKTLFEMEHLLQEQQLDAAKARQRLINLGFSAEQIEKFVADNDTHAEMAVTAPWHGVLVQRHAVEGEAVSSNVPLFAVADLATMWVHLSAYESDLGKIHLEQPLSFVPDGLDGEVFEGRVTWISPEVDPQTRTIEVRGELTNTRDALRANMFGKGRLLSRSNATATVVPSSAVQSHEGHYIVLVHSRPNEYEARRVSIGIKSKDGWEVTSGLRPGEKIVTAGSFLLKSNLENPAFGEIESP